LGAIGKGNMILGGGFIGQMHKTMEQNRAMLQKNDGRASHLKKYRTIKREMASTVHGTMSPEERASIHREIRDDQRRQRMKQVYIMLASIIIVGILVLIFNLKMKQPLIDFLR
jgi:hypothetical protein